MVNALVVEDEYANRRFLVFALEDRGYQVREAGDGEIAMQRISEQRPDVIFVDIMMPVMDGFELISILRGNPQTSGIPLVLVSAMDPYHTKGKARQFDVEHHLTKPWEPWALDAVLERALGNGGGKRSNAAKYII